MNERSDLADSLAERVNRLMGEQTLLRYIVRPTTDKLPLWPIFGLFEQTVNLAKLTPL